jgi:ABC-2 type transport system ATP-binding protein
LRITEKTLASKASNPEPALVTAPMANPDSVTDLLIALREGNIHLASLSVQDPTLDEVFLALTGTLKLEGMGQ